MKKLSISICTIAALAMLIVGYFSKAVAQNASPAGQSTSSKADTDALPDGPGKAVILEQCTSCHSVSTVTGKRASQDDWAQIVNDMMTRGATLTDDQADQVVQYLAAHFGTSDSKAAGASPPQSAAPPTTPDKTAPGAASPPASSTPQAAVNVNKATAEEMASTLGLSKAEGEAIVRYRDQHGSFKNLQDLSAVPGISPEKIKANEKLITF